MEQLHHQPAATASPPPAAPKQKKYEGLRSVLATVGLLLLAPVIAVVLTAFVFQSYEVDGPSMEKTLQDKDRLIVLKLPKTWAQATGNVYAPKRGEVIIFTRKGTIDHNNTQDKQLIKRVIGVPGDRVVIKDGAITIYNNEHPEGFNPDANTSWGNSIQSTPGNIDITVKQDEVFVLGDNRHNSLDSRAFGTVQDKHIVGRLSLRVFPFNKLTAY